MILANSGCSSDSGADLGPDSASNSSTDTDTSSGCESDSSSSSNSSSSSGSGSSSCSSENESEPPASPKDKKDKKVITLESGNEGPGIDSGDGGWTSHSCTLLNADSSQPCACGARIGEVKQQIESEELVNLGEEITELNTKSYKVGAPLTAIAGVNPKNAVFVGGLNSLTWRFVIKPAYIIKFMAKKGSKAETEAVVIHIVKVFAFRTRGRPKWDLIVVCKSGPRTIQANQVVKTFMPRLCEGQRLNLANISAEPYLQTYILSLEVTSVCFLSISLVHHFVGVNDILFLGSCTGCTTRFQTARTSAK